MARMSAALSILQQGARQSALGPAKGVAQDFDGARCFASASASDLCSLHFDPTAKDYEDISKGVPRNREPPELLETGWKR